MRTTRLITVSITAIAAIACDRDVTLEPQDIIVNVPPDPTPPAPVTENDYTFTLPSDPVAPAPTTADLILDIASEDERPIPFRVTLDGTPLVTTTVTVDPAVDHVFAFGDTAGYVTPDPITVPAGTVPVGTTRTIPVVYVRVPPVEPVEPPVRCIVTTDDFGTRVPAPITLGDAEVGLDMNHQRTGRACAALEPEDAFVVGELASYTAPATREYGVAAFTGRTLTVTYAKPNGAQWCTERQNHVGQVITPPMWMDGVATMGACVAIDVGFPHEQTYGDAPGLWTPHPLRIRPFALAPGETRSTVKIYLDGFVRPATRCVETHPDDVNPEIMMDGRSIGWRIGDALPCAIVDADAESTVAFGADASRTAPPPVTLNPVGEQYTEDVVLALYDAHRLALPCVRALDPWGNPIGVPMTISDRSRPARWDRPTCVAIDPTAETVVTLGAFDTAPNLESPEPLIIPAGTLRAGEQRTFEITFELRVDPQPPEPPKPPTGIVFIIGPRVDDLDIPLPAPVRVDDAQPYEWTSTIEFALDGVRTIEFLPATPGLMSPPPLTINGNDPAASDGMFNEDRNVWMWVVRYIDAESVTLTCVDVRGHNDEPLRGAESKVVFDAEYHGIAERDRVDGQYLGMPCAYFTVRGDHLITASGRDYHAQPQPITIPAGVLVPGTIHVVRISYVLASHAETIAVTTMGALGELFIDGHSIGWNPYLDGETLVTVNRTRPVTLTFGDVAGHTTADPVIVDLALPVPAGGGGSLPPIEPPSDVARVILALYDADHLALPCVRVRDPWGGTLAVPVTVNGQQRESRWNRPTCATIDPSTDTTFALPPYSDFTVPDPIAIPAHDMRPGERRELTMAYTEARPTYVGAEIRMVGPIIDGHTDIPFDGRADIDALDGSHCCTDRIAFSIDTNTETEIHAIFRDAGFGLTPPPPLTIDPQNPAASNGTFHAERDTWVWTVRYTTTEPIALPCVEMRDHNDVVIPIRNAATSPLFDAVPIRMALDDLRCAYATVRDAHAIATWGGVPGFSAQREIMVPPRVLRENRIHIFTFVFIPETLIGYVCVATDGPNGEIFLNGHSAGWNALGRTPTDLCIPIDITQPVRISYEDIPGFRTPDPMIIPAFAIAHGETMNVVGEYQ